MDTEQRAYLQRLLARSAELCVHSAWLQRAALEACADAEEAYLRLSHVRALRLPPQAHDRTPRAPWSTIR